jgi:acyl-CoA reductase-like NAD-dependent aldehyde dehydrogenase
MLIDGDWADATGGGTFDVFNPANGEKVGSVPKGGREDVKRAVDAAKEAFKKWSETPALDRSRLLFKIAEMVRAESDGLAKMLTTEQGKPLNEAKGEIGSFANSCEYYAGLVGRERGAQTPFSTGEGFFIVTKRPIGVVGAILP